MSTCRMSSKIDIWWHYIELQPNRPIRLKRTNLNPPNSVFTDNLRQNCPFNKILLSDWSMVATKSLSALKTNVNVILSASHSITNYKCYNLNRLPSKLFCPAWAAIRWGSKLLIRYIYIYISLWSEYSPRRTHATRARSSLL